MRDLTFEADFSLLAANIRGHSRMCCELEGLDGIAQEIKYHCSCFTQYVKKKKKLRRFLDDAADTT